MDHQVEDASYLEHWRAAEVRETLPPCLTTGRNCGAADCPYPTNYPWDQDTRVIAAEGE